MRKAKLLVPVVFIALAIPAIAQQCANLVSDEVGILKNQIVLEEGAKALVDQGADVHVVALDMGRYGTHLKDAEDAYERACPNWLAPNGSRKSNLFVMMIAPKQRLKNVFFGGAYTGVFPDEDTINMLYSKYANSYFRGGQWEEGLSVALAGFGRRVADFHNEARQAKTTINNPTDWTPIAHFFEWCLVLLGFVFLVGLVIYFIRRSVKREQAQQDALAAQSKAAKLFNALSASHPKFNIISSEYSSLSGQTMSDPNQEGLSEEAYRSIERQWTQMATLIENGGETKIKETPKTYDVGRELKAAERTRHKERETRLEPRTTVVHETSNNDLVTGIVLGEALSGRHEHHHHDEPSRSSSSDWGSSSSGSSGSDSSFGFGSNSGSSGSDSGWGGGGDSGSSGGSGGDSNW